MTDFKVGDRVRSTTQGGAYPHGSLATVIRVGPKKAVIVKPDNGLTEESWWREPSGCSAGFTFELVPQPDYHNAKNHLNYALHDLRRGLVVQAFERVTKALEELAK